MEAVALPQELLDIDPELLLQEIEVNRGEHFPSKSFVPNIGQERALKCYQQKHPTYGDYPETCIMLGGNGVGKTALLAIFLAGCTLGKEFLNPRYYNFDFFDEMAEIRRKRKLRVRIVCDGADLEESGSVYEQISQWIPLAVFRNKQSGAYYKKITIPAPSPEFHETVIDIKTHEQKKVAHSGSNLDLIIFNEPAPDEIFSENKSRARSDNSKIAMFLTPLDLAAYICGLIEDTKIEGQLYHTECPIWDNCKDIPGTRGHLSRRKIEDQITAWESLDPTQVPARELGKFQHLAGAIFTLFSKPVHVIDPIPIRDNWFVFQVVDPHPVKPHFSIHMAITPEGDYYIIAEHPDKIWNKIPSTSLTIRDFGREYKRIENGKHDQFQYIQNLNVSERIGDPNAFKERLQNANRTVQMQYSLDCNLWYNIKNVDNSISLRINKIRELIGYDYRRPVDSQNRPKLKVFSSCTNCIYALQFFSMKSLAKGGFNYGAFDETWECPISCIGYGVTTITYWKTPTTQNGYNDDYMEIMKSRDPRHAPRNEEFEYEENDVYEPHYVGGGF